MGWVLLKRVHPERNEVILVTDRMYVQSGGARLNWEVLAQGTDAHYEMLLDMAKLTDSYVPLSVNRKMETDLYYETKGHNNVS